MPENKSIIQKITRLSPVSFACIVCLFFMPFLEFKCNGEKYFSVTGIDMVYGGEIEWQNTDTSKNNSKDSLVNKIEGYKNMYDQDIKEQKIKTKKIETLMKEDHQNIKPQLLVVLGFLCALMGVFLFKNNPKISKMKMTIAISGLVFLSTFRIYMLSTYDVNFGGVTSDNMRLVHFLPAFDFVCFLFLIIAIIQWIYNRQEKQKKMLSEIDDDF